MADIIYYVNLSAAIKLSRQFWNLFFILLTWFFGPKIKFCEFIEDD